MYVRFGGGAAGARRRTAGGTDRAESRRAEGPGMPQVAAGLCLGRRTLSRLRQHRVSAGDPTGLRLGRGRHPRGLRILRRRTRRLTGHRNRSSASLDRRRLRPAVPTAKTVESGTHRRGASLAGPQNRRTNPTLDLGGLRRCRPCPQRLRRHDALATIRYPVIRRHPARRPGIGCGTSPTVPQHPRCVQLRLQRWVENHRGQSRRR